jgi:hypothetical protein
MQVRFQPAVTSRNITMNITNIKPISAQKTGSNWLLTVKYTATFSSEEATTHNYTFRDAISIREEDDTSGDDVVTGFLAASNFNPSGLSVQRTLVAKVSEEDLDTELGGEEIYARIRLRNLTTSGVPLEKNTARIFLAP